MILAPNHNIYLIGLPGSGKSKYGKKIAEYLKREFIDTDTWIEVQTRLSITDIFEQYGEDKFRELEHQTAQHFSKEYRKVISTGGGLPCFHDNMSILNNSGITIYLEIPTPILASRIMDSDHRPAYAHLDKNGVLELLNNTLENRKAHYEKAHFTIQYDGQNNWRSIRNKIDDILVDISK